MVFRWLGLLEVDERVVYYRGFAMARGRPHKELTDYLPEVEAGIRNLAEERSYRTHPASHFLQTVVDTENAITHCEQNFTKRRGGDYTQVSNKHLRTINRAVLPALMGHFEIFQISLFAGLVEATRMVEGFDAKIFAKELKKSYGLEINVQRSLAFRGREVDIGDLIADSLPGWHDSSKVNGYFALVCKDSQFYSNNNIRTLNVLWQFRHSIVHTGGRLTTADAHKLTDLQGFENVRLDFEAKFLFGVARRFHTVVGKSVQRLKERFFQLRLRQNLTESEEEELQNLFECQSPRLSWLCSE